MQPLKRDPGCCTLLFKRHARPPLRSSSNLVICSRLFQIWVWIHSTWLPWFTTLTRQTTATQADCGVIGNVATIAKSEAVAHPQDVASTNTSSREHASRDQLRAERFSTASNDVEAVGDKTSSTITLEQYPVPSKKEAATLRKVADAIPTKAYLLCIVEFAERASYYGVKTVFSNFMQFPLPEGGNGAGAPARGTEDTAGALDRGIQFSVAIGLLFL